MLRDRRELARYVAISQVGLEMVAPVVLGLVLDHYFRWSPWGVIVGAVIGLIGGVAHLVHLAGKAAQDTDKRKPPGEQPPQ